MHEQLAAKSPEKEQSVNHEQRALREAFEPSGVDGKKLEAVVARFNEALDDGQSYDTALNKAILEAKVIGTTPVELKAYFWDSMDPNRTEGELPRRAIDRALDGLDLDDKSRESSRQTFTSALLQDHQYVKDWEHGGQMQGWERAAVIEQDVAALANIEYPLNVALLRANNQSMESAANKSARERFYAGLDPDHGRDDQPKDRAQQLHLGEFATEHIA